MNRGEFGSKPSHYSISDAARGAYIGLMLGGAVDDHEPDPDPAPAGVVGECWANARALCRLSPERLAYVEGIVRRGPDQPWEMHGYALDREAGHVVEATTGYERSVAYRGLVLDLAAVDARLVASQDETFVVWSLIAEAIDDAMSAVIALRL